jgi:membrane protein YdbS with pleckstrin-like domain
MVGSEDMSVAQAAPGGGFRHLDPKVRLRWAVNGTVVALVVGVILIAIGVIGEDAGFAVPAGVAFAVVGSGFALVWSRIEWARWTWAAGDDALELRHGVITKDASLVPYHRIQQIDLHRDPVERMLGLSTLILRTAAATTDARIPGVATDEAETLRHRLLARAGIDDAV